MKIAIGSDSATELTVHLFEELKKAGHDVICFGPIRPGDPARDWPVVAADVAQAVARNEAHEGIVCCWSGTGVSIAANKVPGIRAALVRDAETARAARIYNHANVLALSLRATSVAVMKEILQTWFATPTDSGDAASEWNREQVQRVDELDKH